MEIISAEEKMVVQYGLETLISNLLGFGVILFVGGCLGHMLCSFLLGLFIFPLRKYAGGFHANTRSNCIIISIGMLLLSLCIFTLKEWTVMGYVVITLVLFAVIFFMAPIDNFNKVLDDLEYQIYRKSSRYILCVEGIWFAFAIIFGLKSIYMAITMSFFIVAISLVAGKISKMKL